MARGVRYRAHNVAVGPWWFATDPGRAHDGGRFDLADPHGTCYVATGIEAAVRERLGPRAAGRRWLPDGPLLAATTVSLLDPALRPLRGRIANVLDGRASRWVTREISTILDYPLTRAWAAALHAAGFSGIRYEPRLATGSVYCEAWFGPKGAHALASAAVSNWRDGLPIRGVIRVSRATIID